MRKIQTPGRPPHHARRREPADVDRLLGGRARHALRLRAAEPRQRGREPPLLRSRRRPADHGLHQRGARAASPGARRHDAGCVHHLAFAVSKATFDQAVERLDERGIEHSGVKDRGFMDSIYFEDPLGLLIELAAYRFEPPHGSHARRRPARGAQAARRARRPQHRPEHLADAIELLVERSRAVALGRPLAQAAVRRLDGCCHDLARAAARSGTPGPLRPGCGRRSRPPPRLRFAEPAAHRCFQHRQASVSTPQTHQLAPRSRRSHGITHLAVPDGHELEVAGRSITVTSPDKVFFSERGETKLDVVRYYLAVEEPFLGACGWPADADAALPERR